MPFKSDIESSLETLVDIVGRINLLLLSMGSSLDVQLLEHLNKIIAENAILVAAKKKEEQRKEELMRKYVAALSLPLMSKGKKEKRREEDGESKEEDEKEGEQREGQKEKVAAKKFVALLAKQKKLNEDGKDEEKDLKEKEGEDDEKEKGEEDEKERKAKPNGNSRWLNFSADAERALKNNDVDDDDKDNDVDDNRRMMALFFSSTFFALWKQLSLFLLSVLVVIAASLLFVSLVPHCPDGMNHFLPKRGYCYGFYDFNGTATLEQAKEKCLVRAQTAMIWMT